MRKPIIGDKYIIEIDSHMTNKKGDLYGVKGFKSLVFDQNGLDKLTPYSADEVYAKGHEHGYINGHEASEKAGAAFYDDGYQRGLNDAWKAARKIVLPPTDGGYSTYELDACFGKERKSFYCFIGDRTAAEVIEKIREYEERKAKAEESKAKEDAEIKIGDEVTLDFFGQEIKAIALECDEGMRKILTSDGEVFTAKNDALLKKTGRHVDLSELFGG